MIGNYFAQLTASKRSSLALLASCAIFTAGCSNMTSTAPDTNSFSTAATLSGRVHGGNQPVVGAAVQLWYAGQAPAAPALAASTVTDSTGAFSFTKDATDGETPTTVNEFSCPTVSGTTNPLVYVVSIGGNTLNDGSSANNTAAVFLGVYDVCNNLGTPHFLHLSEATTAATMVAVQQFFNPAFDTLSADGTGAQKLIVQNVKNTIALLANIADGSVSGTTTLNAATGGTSNINSAVTMNATPEPGKISLLANIMAACVDNASATATPCTTLFNAAVPPVPNTTTNNPVSYAKAKDTLQALFYMLTNPTSTAAGTSNMSTIFGLAGGLSGPYQPALATQPTDWTVAINYSSTSTCGTPTGGSGGFISGPADIGIDNADNLWIANSQASTGNLIEISAAGIPTVCLQVGSGGSKSGGVVDINGNIWTGAGNSVYRYNPSLKTMLAMPAGVAVLGVTTDGNGNIYFSSTNGSLYELPNGTAAPSAVTPVQISSTVGTYPIRLMPDFQGEVNKVANPSNIWVSSGAAFVSEVSPSTSGAAMNGFVTAPLATSGSSYGLSINQINSIFVSAMDTNAVTSLVLHSGSYAAPTGWPFTATSAGIAGPTAISIDGRSNTWLPNNTNGTSTGSISEISDTPTATSPSTGFQRTSSYLNSSRILVIDQAGNIWVAGDGANFITEIVGAAVPLYQPYSMGLTNGRYQAIP
jgi:hypothetical protein